VAFFCEASDSIFQFRNDAGAAAITRNDWLSLENLKSSFIWEIRTLIVSGITMGVAVFDTRVASAVGSVITTFVLITDAIFSVIVTYIFLEPMLKILRAVGGEVRTAASRRLERTKWWNFAGVLVVVGSSTALYVNMIVYQMLTFYRQYDLANSVWGNPFTFGLAVDSILNTLGMILLCGMFKDVSLPNRLAPTSNNKVVTAPKEGEQKELGYINESHAYSEQEARPAESPMPGNSADVTLVEL